jgi:gliding motility-associated-like protein
MLLLQINWKNLRLINLHLSTNQMNNLFNSVKTKVFCTLLICLAFFNTIAQPANDEPCTATALTIGATCNYLATDNVGATSSAGITSPGCGSYTNNDVWFSVVVPSNGNVNVNGLNGTISYSGMAFYTGSNCSTLTLLACDIYSSNNTNAPMLSSSGLVPGSTLYVRYWKYGGGTGTFSICATSFTTPSNNEPTNPLTVVSGTSCSPVSSSVYGATQTLAGCVGNANDDVWFSFVATATEQLITVNPSSTFDPVVQLFSGTPGSLTAIKCDDISFPYGTSGTGYYSGLTIGQTYYYRVYQYSGYFPNTTNSSFTTCVNNNSTPPVNDNCSGATLLTVNSTCIPTIATIYGATPSPSVASCGAITNVYDVWYKFVATNSYQNITATLSNNSSLRLQVFSGFSCNNLTSIFCGLLTSTTTFATIDELVPGETYYYRIFPNSNSYPAVNLTVSTCVTTPAAPTNQDCIAAIPLCNNIYSTTTAYSSFGSYNNEINPSLGCLASGEKNDVWYTFTVINSGTLNFSITPLNLNDDYDWAIYNLTNASCSDINDDASLQVACNFSGVPGVTGPNGLTGYQNSPVINVVAGQTFMVNVSQYSPSNAGYTIDFGGSLATIFDNLAPSMDTANVTCKGELALAFSENVICSNVSATDFTVSGPDGVHTVSSVYSVGCSAGGSMDNNFVLTLSPAITVIGSYTLNLVAGSGTATDLCGNLAPAQTMNFDYTANPYNVTASTAQNALCYGGNTGQVTCAPSGGTGPYTYNWFSTANHNAITQTVNDAFAGTYTVILTDANGCIDTASTVVTQPVDLTTTISSQSSQCLTGNLFNFSATTNAISPTYSWNYGDASALNTATSPSHSYNSSGSYTVTLIVNTISCADTAELTIAVSPMTQVISQVSPTQTVCSGDALNALSVIANGTSLTYQWYSNATASTTAGTSISGALSASYTPSSSATGTTYYYCVVTGTCGSATSLVSGAIIVNTATSILSQVSPTQTVCSGDALNALSVIANGTSLTYQWYSNATASTTGGTSISGALSASYTPSSSATGTTYYYCVVAGTCGSATSLVSGAIIVNTATSILSQVSPTQTVCSGDALNALSVIANGTSLTYQWYSNATASTTGGTSISGALSASYTPSSSTTGTTYYHCVVAGTCGSATSLVSGAIIVNTATSILSQVSPTQTVCSGDALNALSVIANETSLTYQWYSNATASTTGGTSISDALSASYTPSSSATGTTYYYCVVAGTCGSATSLVSGAIIVNIATSILSQVSPTQTVCSGDAVNALSVIANGTSLTYQWYSNATASTTGGTLISGALSASYTPSSSVTGTTYYYCVVTGTCGSATSLVSGAMTVSTIPSAPVIESNLTFCTGKEITPIALSPLVDGNYTWYSDQNLTDIISSSSTFTPTNSTATYFVTATNANSCESEMSQITVVFEDCAINVPTAITPNSDGIDDNWVLANIDAFYPNNQVTIFSRWGDKIFQSVKGSYESNPWNGKINDDELPTGSYFFIIEYNNDSNEIKNGTITIIKK